MMINDQLPDGIWQLQKLFWNPVSQGLANLFFNKNVGGSQICSLSGQSLLVVNQHFLAFFSSSALREDRKNKEIVLQLHFFR